LAAIVTKTDRLVAVPPGPTLALMPVPLNVTVVAPARLFPVIAAMNVLPTSPVGGVIALIAGVVPVTLKLTVAEVPPPGEGLTTTIPKVPTLTKYEPGTTAVSVVVFTKVVAIGVEPI
jgi:hypothetical protein